LDKLIAELLAAALAAVNPHSAVDRYLQRDGDRLMIADRIYHLAEWDLRCLALGKAAVPMAQAIAEIIGTDLARGLVVTKSDHLGGVIFPAQWEVIEAGHPTPDARSLHAGERLEHLLADVTDRTLIFACISGGASALVTAPKSWNALDRLLRDRMGAEISPQLRETIATDLQSEHIDLADVDREVAISLSAIQLINTALLNSGLNIERINAVRSQLDRFKGGGLVERALPATVISLILSDVIGDSIAAIASGLTNHPAAENILIGSNRQACEAVAKTARKLGYDPQIVTTELEGEAQIRGREIAREIVTKPPKTVLIYGGETTVTLSPNQMGKGGRNQELALAAAIELSDLATPAWVITLATDGTDGPTDAAGATVNERTIARSIELGLDAHAALDRHDSYPLFDRLGTLHHIGATGTNVADITIAIRT
jgi:glycerate 2-kinase